MDNISGHHVDNAMALITRNLEPQIEDILPYHIFPKEIQKYINECETCLGYPKQYTVASILFAISLAIGNTRKIHLIPGYEDMANIFILLLGPPSAGKTRALKNCVKYFHEMDAKNHLETLKDLASYKMRSKEDKDVGSLPSHKNYILDDVTPESIMSELERHDRGSGIVSDEFDQVLNVGKYNGSGSVESTFNSIWSREIKKVTRATKAQIVVRSPFLSIIGGSQYNRANELFKGREDSGFAHRFCYIILKKVPPNKWAKGRGIPELNFDTVTKKIHENLTFGQDEFGEDIPKAVVINNDGVDHIIKWQNDLRDIADHEDDYFKSAVGKMESYALRYSLILHYLKWGTYEGVDEFKVDLETCKNATALTDFFLAQSVNFQQMVYSNDNYADTLPDVKRKLYDALPQNLKRIDAVVAAQKLDISTRATDNFLKDSKLFKKVKQGNYIKIL